MNDTWNGYYHPDDDFFHQDLDNVFYMILQMNQIPEAIFDSKTRTWSIGDNVFWNVGTAAND